MSGARPLRVLLLEDSPSDAELVLRELRRAGYAPVGPRVTNEDEFVRALDPALDVILADYRLPKFNAMQALARLQEAGLEVPFVVVSGQIGEETAVVAMQAGAADYLMKDRLERLGQAVARAVERRQLREAGQRAESARRAQEVYAQAVLDSLSAHIAVLDQAGRITAVNAAWRAFAREAGLPAPDAVGPGVDYLAACRAAPGDPHADAAREGIEAVLAGRTRYFALEYPCHSPGVPRWFILRASPLVGTRGAVVAHQDITSRKLAEARLREAEGRYRGIFEGAADGIFLSTPDGRYVAANAAAATMLGYASADELVGAITDIRTQVYADPADRDRMDELVRAQGAVHGFETQLRRRDGGRIWASLSVRILPGDDGAPRYRLGMVEDITERRRTEEKVARLTRIRIMMAAINAAMVRTTERDALLEAACRIAVAHGGLRSAAVLAPRDSPDAPQIRFAAGEPFAIASQPEAPEAALLRTVVDAARRDRRAVSCAAVGAARRRAAGEPPAEETGACMALPLQMQSEVTDVLLLGAAAPEFFTDDEIGALEELAADVSFGLTHIAKLREIEYLAHYDLLTGLPNRELFTERLDLLLQGARDGPGAAVAIVDLVRFETVNESLGRTAGDAVLQATADRLRESVEAAGAVARFLGGTFAVALRKVADAAAAARLVEEKVLQPVEAPLALDRHEVRVALRAGVAMFPADGDSAERLVQNAEVALKRARASGERLVFYAPDMNARVAERFALEGRLRRAVAAEHFVLHYQPRIKLATGAACGAEALIRWNEPGEGLIAPGRFVPVLEETGLIQAVGDWALRQAVRDQASLAARGHANLRLSVNVSPLQLRQRDFVERVAAALDEAPGRPAIDVEVTETVLMQDVERSVASLHALRRLGLEISVDDFGTGYSSLAYLTRLPINALKIDRSFVSTMTEAPESMTIVATIISLAHALNLLVVAEGVETEEQARMLRLLRCDEVQGFLFSRPLPLDGLESLLGSHASFPVPPGAARH